MKVITLRLIVKYKENKLNPLLVDLNASLGIPDGITGTGTIH